MGLMRVLITGASSGIGLELAKIFATNGYDLILVARNIGELKQISENWQVQVECLSFDLSQIAQVKNLVNAISNKEIDVLVNNAGFGDYGSLIDLEPDKQIEMINLNISALTYLSQIYAKQMCARGSGTILNLASVAAFLPGPLMATYYASKAYVLSFSYALAEEASHYGVEVSVACPGTTASNFGSAAGVNHTVAFSKTMSSAEVAKIIYQKLMAGKKLIITGWKNKLLVALLRYLPRSWAAKINYCLLKT